MSNEFLKRLPNESDFEYKLRVCMGKLNKQVKVEWDEIVEILGEDCSADHLRKVSYGLREYHLHMTSDGKSHNRILAISDLHVPFQLPVTAFSDYVGITDTIVLGGDLIDCQSISKFPKTYRVGMMEEIIEGRQYIIDLISFIKPKKVVAIYGNHEIRFQSFLARNLDSDLLELMPQTPLELIFNDGFNHYNKRIKAKTWYEPLNKIFSDIEIVYEDNWWCKIGKTIFCHPSAYSTGMMKTAEKAMMYFNTQDKDYNAVVMAHTHQMGEYFKGNITLYEQGTCSDTKKMNYTDGKLYNPQQSGFLYMCHDSEGNILRDKTKLIKL